MKFFNHDIRGAAPEWLRLSRHHACRALCLTAPGDVIQLPSALRAHWAWIREHYRRCGLSVTDRVVWSSRLEVIADYPGHELSAAFFGDAEQRWRPDAPRHEAARRFSSKAVFDTFARDNGLSTPSSCAFNEGRWTADLDSVGFPCYLKPDISIAGIGVVRCGDRDALNRAVARLPRGEAFQVQRALDGATIVNLQYAAQPSGLRRLNAAERLMRGGVEMGARAPVEGVPWARLDRLAAAMVESGLRGIFSIDVALLPEGEAPGFQVIGCNPRYDASTYCHAIARKLGVSEWRSLRPRSAVRSLSELGLGELEYDPSSGEGVVVVNWGGIRNGRPQLMAIGSSGASLAREVKRRAAARRPVALSLTPPPQPPGERLLLTHREMAWATGGRWVALPEHELQLSGVSIERGELRPGELYVYHRKRDPDGRAAGPVVANALERGAAAVMVREGSVDGETTPRLEVADPQKGLQDLATAASLKFDGTRVMVVGSHGKTGFKTQLYHLIHRQLPTHAHLTSKNLKRSVWCTLASIPRGAGNAIVEVAVPASGIGRERALLVRPDYCVFTGIGPEHMRSHRTLERLLHNKADVVSGLRPGGRCLLNSDDEHAEALRAAIRERSDCPLLTFGSAPGCDGRLLGARFIDTRWRVSAEILGERVEYELPLMESYAPIASVGVLLMARLLGADLTRSAAEYPSYRNFMSSGNLYRVHAVTGAFLLYDQGRRGELKGFESMFELMARMHPAEGGRKIAVVSEFINLEDNPEVEPDLARMRGLMERAGIDLLYTVKAFKRHAAAVPATTEWRLHGDRVEVIEADLVATLRANDMLFVRGVLKAGLSGLAERLRELGANGGGVEQIY